MRRPHSDLMGVEAILNMNNPVVSHIPESSTRLKNAYEESLAVLSETKDGRNEKQSARSFRNSMPLHIDAVSLQKRALDDAARALATLWKVPAHGPARSHHR
jgi:hypothetical protein